LAITFAACQRREAVELRTPLHLGSNEEWSFATHPELSLSAEQLRTMTSNVFLATGLFVASPTSNASSRGILHVMSVELQPTGAANEVHAQVRVRVEYIPAGGDENNTIIAVASGTSRGARDASTALACETAITRAVQQITSELQGGLKTTDNLVADLSSTDSSRVSVALDRLAAKRHAAAFEPLIRQLRENDPDVALKALSALVIYNDQRAVRPIIEEAERRDFSFQLEALYALGSIGGEEAEAYLFMIERGHADRRAQVAASEALILTQRRANRARNEAPETVR
jgi:ribosomal protein S9